MATSIDIILRPNVYSDGTQPVTIRIISNRKVSYKTLFRIFPIDWDSVKKQVNRSHPNQIHFNDSISEKYYSLEKKLLTLNADNSVIDSLSISGSN